MYLQYIIIFQSIRQQFSKGTLGEEPTEHEILYPFRSVRRLHWGLKNGSMTLSFASQLQLKLRLQGNHHGGCRL